MPGTADKVHIKKGIFRVVVKSTDPASPYAIAVNRCFLREVSLDRFRDEDTQLFLNGEATGLNGEAAKQAAAALVSLVPSTSLFGAAALVASILMIPVAGAMIEPDTATAAYCTIDPLVDETEASSTPPEETFKPSLAATNIFGPSAADRVYLPTEKAEKQKAGLAIFGLEVESGSDVVLDNK